MFEETVETENMFSLEFSYIGKQNPSGRRLWKATAKPFMNINKIFPTKQKYVLRMVEEAKKDPNIQKIIIFGSSLLPRCNLWSDIDIYFECKEDPVRLPSIGDSVQAFDKFTNFGVSNDFLSEIKKTGVVVYERQ